MNSLLPGPRTLSLLLFATPLGLVEVLTSPLKDQSNFAELGNVAAHQTASAFSMVVGMVTTLLGLVVFLGLADHCRPAAPRLAGFAGWLLAFAMAAFLGGQVFNALELALVREGIPRRQAAHLLDALVKVPSAAMLFALFLGGAVIGLTCLGVLVWRAGLPKPAALMLIAFNPVDLLTSGVLGELVAHLLMYAAFVWIGVVILRRRAAGDVRPVDASENRVELKHA